MFNQQVYAQTCLRLCRDLLAVANAAVWTAGEVRVRRHVVACAGVAVGECVDLLRLFFFALLFCDRTDFFWSLSGMPWHVLACWWPEQWQQKPRNPRKAKPTQGSHQNELPCCFCNNCIIVIAISGSCNPHACQAPGMSAPHMACHFSFYLLIHHRSIPLLLLWKLTPNVTACTTLSSAPHFIRHRFLLIVWILLQAPQVVDMQGKVVIVTGGNAGIGLVSGRVRARCVRVRTRVWHCFSFLLQREQQYCCCAPFPLCLFFDQSNCSRDLLLSFWLLRFL